jgi:hypothetical protein
MGSNPGAIVWTFLHISHIINAERIKSNKGENYLSSPMSS